MPEDQLVIADHTRVVLDTCNRQSRDAIAERVRVNLNDAGYFYTPKDLEDSIQDAYDEIVALAGSLQKSTAISVTTNSYYDLYALIPDFIAVRGIFNHRVKRWLVPKSVNFLVSIRDDWELQVGEPEFFVPINFRYVAIYPKPSVASGQFWLAYYAGTETLIGSDVPNLVTTSGEKAVEYYVTADLYEQAEEWVKAQEYYTMYLEELSKIKDTRNNIRLPDYSARLR